MTRRSRVLVLDDDPTLRETLDEILSDEGYEVRAASNGQEGLGQLDGRRANLEEAGRTLGATATLAKPFGLEELLATVKRLLPRD